MLATASHLSPKVLFQTRIVLKRSEGMPTHRPKRTASSVCDRRLRGGPTEYQSRCKTTRVPACRNPADLHPSGVETTDRPSVLSAQDPAPLIYGEPAYGMRYGRRDLYGHEGRHTQRPGSSGSRGGHLCARGDGRVVIFDSMEKNVAGHAEF